MPILGICDQLKRDEGLRLTAYKDTRGILTIGYGRNLQNKGISLSEAEMLLHDDVADVGQQLSGLLPWTNQLDDVRRGVLLNMAYNLGMAGLLEFNTFLSLLKAGDWAGAATDLANTLWAKQVGARADRLEQQLISGKWV